MAETYAEFFQRVTGNEILPYQQAFGNDPFGSKLVVVPTGLGKTDTVLMPWLYAQAAGSKAPTRLILVLPRQNLTVQTAKTARKRVEAAGLGGEVRVLELMAGRKENGDTLGPKERCIIVCTQDLYFSRALNRGYARRPPRWPIDFALYNQDCLIVLDEIQLMDDALATSRQLDAFRAEFGTFGEAACVWMSATVNPEWIKTVDARPSPPVIKLNEEDFQTEVVKKRTRAQKALRQAPESCRMSAGCAAFVLEQHRAWTRSLVIANTVPRAREIFGAVRAKFPGALLLHSRFRPVDRATAADALQGAIPPEGQIVVATQVLEAGVDITSRLLVTDAAPWGSLVQRFGRVNRYGDDSDAEIYWVDQPSFAKQKEISYLPYGDAEVLRAMERLKGLTSAAPADLPQEDGPEPWQHVLRRADLLDLFDTTPDLGGNDIDVSRFIRATEDKDAYLAWRDWETDGAPPEEMPDLNDGELCPVPVGDLREFGKKHRIYCWNFAIETWQPVERAFPGMIAVARTQEGGYSTAEGWSPQSKAKVPLVASGGRPAEGDTSDELSFPEKDYRQTLVAHSRRVMEEMDVLLADSGLPADLQEALRTAAAKHDWGKAHAVFQRTLHGQDEWTELLAKQVGRGKHKRKHFRHELASALAMLAAGDSDLAAYVVAAHHGRVRVGLRSMPGEREDNEVRTTRGIQEGEVLPACEVAPGLEVPQIELSLGLMEFGAEGGSWTDRVLRLRDELGPFRLAYLEMMLRAADEKASAEPRLEAQACTS